MRSTLLFGVLFFLAGFAAIKNKKRGLAVAFLGYVLAVADMLALAMTKRHINFFDLQCDLGVGGGG